MQRNPGLSNGVEYGGGIVLRFNGETWKTFSAGTDHDLYGVSGSGLEKLFLCGLNGTLIRFENNAWQQELPDAVTKTTWDNVVEVAPATARERSSA